MYFFQQNLSDEMGKSDQIIEGIVRKIEKTGMELSAYAGKKSELTIDGGRSNQIIKLIMMALNFNLHLVIANFLLSRCTMSIPLFLSGC